MVCRKCGQTIEVGRNSLCPHCGEPVSQKLAGMLKTSTILISSDDTASVFRSIKDIPEPLRKKLLRSTNGLNARTILIADRRGRQEIARAMRKLPGTVLERRIRRLSLPQAIAILLAAASGLIAWLILSQTW
jgi:RNA polymerase subunit RPABC4/transcription elongation factor Spt4